MPHSLGRLVGIVISSSAAAVEYNADLGEDNDAEVEKASTALKSEAINTSVELLILICYWECIVVQYLSATYCLVEMEFLLFR